VRSLLTRAQANAFATEVNLDLDGICLACLSIVSFAIDGGDPREIAGALRRMTPDLWDDGLAEQALVAAIRARDAGAVHGEKAVACLEQHAGQSSVARAMVRRLAEELTRRPQTEIALESRARGRLPLAPPELN
jgi:hypothetical protein